jgi:hypothetical protein
LAQSKLQSDNNEPKLGSLTPLAAATLALLWSCKGDDIHFAVLADDYNHMYQSRSSTPTTGNKQTGKVNNAGPKNSDQPTQEHENDEAIHEQSSTSGDYVEMKLSNMKTPVDRPPSPKSFLANNPIQLAAKAVLSIGARDMKKSKSVNDIKHAEKISSDNHSLPQETVKSGHKPSNDSVVDDDHVNEIARHKAAKKQQKNLPGRPFATALMILGFPRVSIVQPEHSSLIDELLNDKENVDHIDQEKRQGLSKESDSKQISIESSEGLNELSLKLPSDDSSLKNAVPSPSIDNCHASFVKYKHNRVPLNINSTRIEFIEAIPEVYKERHHQYVDAHTALIIYLWKYGARLVDGAVRVPLDSILTQKVHQFSLTQRSTDSIATQANPFIKLYDILDHNMKNYELKTLNKPDKLSEPQGMLALEHLLRRLGGMHENFLETVLLPQMHHAVGKIASIGKGNQGVNEIYGNTPQASPHMKFRRSSFIRQSYDPLIEDLLGQLQYHSLAQSKMNSKFFLKDVKNVNYRMGSIADDIISLRKKMATIHNALDASSSLSDKVVHMLKTKCMTEEQQQRVEESHVDMIFSSLVSEERPATSFMTAELND